MSPTAQEEQNGLSKFVQRMSRVMQRTSSDNSHRRSSTLSRPEQPMTGECSTAIRPKSESSATAPVQEPVSEKKTKMGQPISVPHWRAIQQDKARALFAKYGLTLGTDKSKLSSEVVTVQRAVKPIRIRVRRTCHRCETTFGPDKVCDSCQHVRCKQCPRYPPRKPKDAVVDVERPITPEAEPDVRETQTKNDQEEIKMSVPCLKIPTHTGGQDLVYQPIEQRVRRICHRCNTVFDRHSKECASCHHTRCKKCPRDPPNPGKYPDRSSGDVDPPREKPERVWRKPRMRVRYTCHKCSSLYRAGEKTCLGCGEAKGPNTIRYPPKKVKVPPDPEIVRRVEERLKELGIRS